MKNKMLKRVFAFVMAISMVAPSVAFAENESTDLGDAIADSFAEVLSTQETSTDDFQTSYEDGNVIIGDYSMDAVHQAVLVLNTDMTTVADVTKEMIEYINQGEDNFTSIPADLEDGTYYAYIGGNGEVLTSSFEVSTYVATPTPEPTAEPTVEPTQEPTPAPVTGPTFTQGKTNPNRLTLNYNDATEVTLVMYVNAGEDSADYNSYNKMLAVGKTARDASGNRLNHNRGYNVFDTITDGAQYELERSGYHTFRITYLDAEGASKNVYTKIYIENSVAPELTQDSENPNLVTLNENSAARVLCVYFSSTGDEKVDYTTWTAFEARGKAEVHPDYGTWSNPLCGYYYFVDLADGSTEILERPGYYTAVIRYADIYNNVHEIQQILYTPEYSIPQITQAEPGSSALVLDYNGATAIDSILMVNVDDDSTYHYTTWDDYIATGTAAKRADGVNGLNPAPGYDYFRNVYDGATHIADEIGYHVFRIRYKNAKGKWKYANQSIYVGENVAPTLEVDHETATVTLRTGEAQSITFAVYAHLGKYGDAYNNFRSWAVFVEHGLAAKDDNGNALNPSNGYSSVGTKDGASATMKHAGKYAGLVKYVDASGVTRFKSVIYTIE